MGIIKIELKFIRVWTFIMKYKQTTCFETTFWFIIDVIIVFVPFLYVFYQKKCELFFNHLS